jgi:hypothetical protein
MSNYDGLSYDERESIQILVRSAGWKTLMRHIVTPFLQQTNARLDAIGTTQEQTQFYRGCKSSVKHFVESVYKIGQMRDPFTEHQEAFLLTLQIPEGETVVEQASPAKTVQYGLPKKRSLSPVL